MRILIIESEPAIIEVFEKLLAEDGHDVCVCPTTRAGEGTEALRMAANADVVLLGLTLFAADAPMLAWRIRERFPKVRIIVSGTLRDLGERLVEIGAADAFLPRPFELDELRAAIGARCHRPSPLISS